MYVSPMYTVLAGWFPFDERIGPSTLVGFGQVLLGFVLVKRRAIRAEVDDFERGRDYSFAAVTDSYSRNSSRRSRYAPGRSCMTQW